MTFEITCHLKMTKMCEMLYKIGKIGCSTFIKWNENPEIWKWQHFPLVAFPIFHSVSKTKIFLWLVSFDLFFPHRLFFFFHWVAQFLNFFQINASSCTLHKTKTKTKKTEDKEKFYQFFFQLETPLSNFIPIPHTVTKNKREKKPHWGVEL